jgi:superfamily I DNA and/or RNA helicase
MQVLKEAHVVFATLSQSGHETLSGVSLSGKAGREKRSLQSGREARSGERFDAVVIDEAAQALETATLVPLQLLASRGQLVLVGDPKQLPATVLSQLAAKQVRSPASMSPSKRPLAKAGLADLMRQVQATSLLVLRLQPYQSHAAFWW